MDEQGMNRREWLTAGAAIGALAALPGTASAQQQKKPPRLSVFALDVHAGKPAAGMRVDVSKLEGDTYRLVKSVQINDTGNTDEPVFTADKMATGDYEFLLYFAEYYNKLGVKLASPPFLNKVPIRFSIADPKQVYHIPVLLTPWSYNTYRGS